MPSITIWTRLEPHSREASMERSLEAAMRDPAWLLARQDQLQEFLGGDAGSPVKATIAFESVRLTSYRASAAGTPVDIGSLPVETHVEHEAVTLPLRGAVQLGLFFERLLAEMPNPTEVVAAFRAAYPLPALPPGLPDEAGARFRLAVVEDGPNATPRVTDGEALYRAIRNAATDVATVAPMPSLTAEQRDAVVPLLADFRSYRGSLYNEAEGDAAWSGFDLHYEFAAGAEAADRQIGLEGRDFTGGRLDWYSFDRGAPLRAASDVAVDVQESTFLPTRLVFRGMPNPTWWNFEDGLIDFGDLQADKVDLAKLLVMEFALVGADDWFQLPLPLEVGSLSSVTTLVVIDAFGERTLIEPTTVASPDLEQPWRMFSLTGGDSARDPLLLAPVLGPVVDGPELEAVLFVRDELAGLAWGIERALPGSLGTSVSGYEAYFRRLAEQPPQPWTRVPGGPDVAYRIATDLPDNWIPFVPVRAQIRPLVFRRGVMGSPSGRPPRALVLEPEHPFYVADEAIPKAGVEIKRRFRYVRSSDGETHVWSAKLVEPGTGPGASGLAFDETLTEAP